MALFHETLSQTRRTNLTNDGDVNGWREKLCNMCIEKIFICRYIHINMYMCVCYEYKNLYSRMNCIRSGCVEGRWPSSSCPRTFLLGDTGYGVSKLEIFLSVLVLKKDLCSCSSKRGSFSIQCVKPCAICSTSDTRKPFLLMSARRSIGV